MIDSQNWPFKYDSDGPLKDYCLDPQKSKAVFKQL